MRVFDDREKILKVLKDPVIWESVSNGANFDKDAFVLPEDWLYLTETENEVFILSASNTVHVNILPHKRGRAYWMCQRFIEWIKDNTDVKELFMVVHERHKNIIKMAAMFGFHVNELKNDRVYMSRSVDL